MSVQVFKIASVVAAYWTTSLCMVFANKYLVDERHPNDIPLFVSWFQCVMSVVLVAMFKAVRGWRTENWLTLAELQTIIFSKAVLAMSGFYLGTLFFNSMCLRLIGTSFYPVSLTGFRHPGNTQKLGGFFGGKTR